MPYSLEIHHIGISGGDATMILVRDNLLLFQDIVCKVLIDAGGESFDNSSAKLSGYLANYGSQPFDYIIASHYHADHISGFAPCAIPFRRFIDMGGYPTGNDRFNPVNPPSSLTDDGTVIAQYQFYIHTGAGGNQQSRVDLPFLRKENFNDQGVLQPAHAGPVRLDLVPGSGITLTCYCAGGVLADGTNALRHSLGRRILQFRTPVLELLNEQGKTAFLNYQTLTEAHLTDEGKRLLALEIDRLLPSVSPNDLSLAFILEWGNFRYFSAGDLSGDLSRTRYANIEEPLIAYLRGQNLLNTAITVMKATHHGSNHNNYPDQVYRALPKSTAVSEENDGDDPGATTRLFTSQRGVGLLQELQPSTIVVSTNQMKGVPGGEFIERAKQYCTRRNAILELHSNVIEDLQRGTFYQVWQKYHDLAREFGPDSEAALQAVLIEQLTTIAFINDCQYPHPQYSSKQKATSVQLRDLAAAVPGTNIALMGDGSATNNQPRAVVVYYPVPKYLYTPAEFKLLPKSSHLVVIDGRPSILGGTRPAYVGSQPVSLSQNRYARVQAYLPRQLQLLQQVVAADARLGTSNGIEFVARNYPSLVSAPAGQRQIDPALATEANLRALMQRAYVQSSSGSYQPNLNALTFYERTTVVALVEHTADTVGDNNVLGYPLPQLPNGIGYHEERPIPGDLTQQLNKRPRTRSLSKNL